MQEGNTRPVSDMGTSYNSASGWQHEAACSTAGLTPDESVAQLDLFSLRTSSELKPYGFDPKRHPKVQRALSFCEQCPVRQQCEDYAKNEVDYPLVGVWGGQYIGWREAKTNLAEAHRQGRKPRNTKDKYDHE